MKEYTRKIMKDVYENALANNGLITEADEEKVFSKAELFGYGVYLPRVFKENGEYFVRFMRGSTCD